MIKPPGSYTNPFTADFIENVKRVQRERRERAAIYEETKQIVERALKPDVSDFAAKVLLAAAKRRGEVVDTTPRFTDDRAGRRAKEICNAARKARGQEEFK